MEDYTINYLHFKKEVTASNKVTDIWAITSTTGSFLGQVRWYGPWRQYCLYPANEVIYNSGCMKDIINHIEALMEERRKKRAQISKIMLEDEP